MVTQSHELELLGKHGDGARHEKEDVGRAWVSAGKAVVVVWGSDDGAHGMQRSNCTVSQTKCYIVNFVTHTRLFCWFSRRIVLSVFVREESVL